MAMRGLVSRLRGYVKHQATPAKESKVYITGGRLSYDSTKHVLKMTERSGGTGRD